MPVRPLLALLAVALLLPSGARAAEVHVEAGAIVYTAAPGETNNLSVSLNAFQGDQDRYYFADDVPITLGAGCEKEEFYDRNRCQAPPGGLPVRVDLGDGADTGQLRVAGVLAGGAGDDKLSGDGIPGVQTFDGGPGEDEFDGDSEPYCNVGGPKVGPDVFVGGAGADLVDYSDQNVNSLTVTIDGRADDGGAGENDDVRTDVEGVRGTSCGANAITGNDGPNTLTGRGTLNGLGGPDTLTGSSGDDVLNGGSGPDQLFGLTGNDTLDGGDGDDFLEGGFDDDVLTGGPGVDSFAGDATASNTIGTGNDTINAQDGIKENVSCGPGSDVANVDSVDQVPVDTQNLCETVNRRKGATPALVRPSAPKLARGGKLRVRLACNVPSAAGCSGTLKVTARPKGRKQVALGSALFGIDRGRTATVSVAVSRRERRALGRAKAIPLTLTAVLRTDEGRRTVTSRLTLKR